MRTTILGKRRRGEAQTEYVIITAMIMICAVVSLFNFFGAVREIALDKKLCINCEMENQEVRETLGPDGLPIDSTNTTGDDSTGTTDDSGTGTSDGTTSTPNYASYANTAWWPFFRLATTVFGASYLEDIWSWFT